MQRRGSDAARDDPSRCRADAAGGCAAGRPNGRRAGGGPGASGGRSRSHPGGRPAGDRDRWSDPREPGVADAGRSSGRAARSARSLRPVRRGDAKPRRDLFGRRYDPPAPSLRAGAGGRRPPDLAAARGGGARPRGQRRGARDPNRPGLDHRDVGGPRGGRLHRAQGHRAAALPGAARLADRGVASARRDRRRDRRGGVRLAAPAPAALDGATAAGPSRGARRARSPAAGRARAIEGQVDAFYVRLSSHSSPLSRLALRVAGADADHRGVRRRACRPRSAGWRRTVRFWRRCSPTSIWSSSPAIDPSARTWRRRCDGCGTSSSAPATNGCWSIPPRRTAHETGESRGLAPPAAGAAAVVVDQGARRAGRHGLSGARRSGRGCGRHGGRACAGPCLGCARWC